MAKTLKEKKADKVAKIMHEWKVGKLKSSSGSKITNQRQAVAVALSESSKVGKRKSNTK